MRYTFSKQKMEPGEYTVTSTAWMREKVKTVSSKIKLMKEYWNT